MGDGNQNKMEFLKRKSRRNNLIKELAKIISVTNNSLLDIEENDLFCKAVFKLLTTREYQISIKEQDYRKNIQASIKLLKNTFEQEEFGNKKARLLFFRDEEIEAVQLSIKELSDALEEILNITKFATGYADFMLVTDDMNFGICIERTEYQYEFYHWGITGPS